MARHDLSVTPFCDTAHMVNAAIQDGPRPDTVSRRTDALIASVSQHHRAVSAHQRRLFAAVAELNRRKAWRVDGATTMVSWLVQRCGVTAATAREWVTAAEKLETLPKISEALSQGKLSFDQVKPLVQVAKPETDAQLAEQATHWSAKQVRELALASNRQSDAEAAGTYTRRFLRFDDRRRSLSGSLPADHYAIVKGALTARASRHVRDHTPFDQRLSDALVEICGGVQRGGGRDLDQQRHRSRPRRDEPDRRCVHRLQRHGSDGDGAADPQRRPGVGVHLPGGLHLDHGVGQ